MSIQYATKRIMGSVWTLAYVKQADGVRIFAYSRDIPEGYESEKDWLRCSLIEEDWSEKGGDQRTVVGVVLAPFRTFQHTANRVADAEEFEVLNPQMVFSYGKEIPDLIQLAFALEGEN